MATLPLESSSNVKVGDREHEIDEHTPLIREESFSTEPSHDVKQNSVITGQRSDADLSSSTDKGKLASSGGFSNSTRRFRRTTSCVEIPEELIKVQHPCCPAAVKVVIIAVIILLLIAAIIMSAALVAYEPISKHTVSNATEKSAVNGTWIGDLTSTLSYHTSMPPGYKTKEPYHTSAPPGDKTTEPVSSPFTSD